MNGFRVRLAVAVAVVLLLGTAGAVLAQQITGNLYGTVNDTDGNPLPGVTVTLSGQGADQVQITNAQGLFRFLGVSPGRVDLEATLEGFSTIEYPNIEIRVNRSVEVQIELSPAIEEVITVTSESPLLDERKIQTGTTITQVELEKIPTARDPWAVLNQTPGVLVDRINVGGNESGQQSVFVGGASDSENDFLVDGIQITDMAAIGASPAYYDFDQFTEMQFSTGGTDVTKNTAGVSLNLVTKRGTNDFRGSGRYNWTDANGFLWIQQSTPDVNPGDFGEGQEAISTNRIRRIEEFGFEAGGPVLKDRIWFWGSWGQNDIKQTAAGGGDDDTLLENTAFKVNAQIAASNSFVGSWNHGDKVKLGRGAGPSRSRETTWDQATPTPYWKFEDTHVFGSNFFLTGAFSEVDGAFSLTAKSIKEAGSVEASAETFYDANGVWHGSYLSGPSERPSEEWKLDGSYFFNTGNTNHELKFGGRFREFESVSPFVWPGGRNLFHVDGQLFGVADPIDTVVAVRGVFPLVTTEYTSFWAQDTLSFGNFTVNAGFRYDLQEGENPPFVAPGNPGFPDVLPDLDFPGNDGGGFEWEDISPRIGVTYALGAERKTLLRASFARFPSALDADVVQRLNPAGFAYAYLDFIDGNGNNMWDDPSIDTLVGLVDARGFDPEDPGSLSDPDQTDPGLDAPLTDELVFSVEHAFLPEFVAGVGLSFRNASDILEDPNLIRDAAGNVRVETVNDYLPDTTCGACSPDGTLKGTRPDGSTYSVPVFYLNPAFSYTGGEFLRNGDREIDSWNVGFNFIKRLSNRWMARGYFGYGEAEWDIPASFTFFQDPNDFVPFDERDFDDSDGDLAVTTSFGSGDKSDVVIQSTWSYNLNGMYQVAPDRPWGFNVAANIYGREGYPLPYYERITLSDGRTRRIEVVNEVDDFRVEDIFTVDFRIDKEFAASENFSFTLGLDLFNAFNEAYVLQRERNLASGRANFLDEALSPRIWRIGVRLNWK